MKSYIFFLIALLGQVVFAEYEYKSTFYGCPEECETQKGPKCEMGLPSNNFFVALHKKYFEDKSFPFCGQHYVGMIIDNKADGKYKIVRGKVVDQCGSCGETQVDLSSPMFASIARKTTGVVDMVFVIVNGEGEITKGPVYNKSSLENFAKKQGVSQNDILTSFKQAAKNMNQQGLSGLVQYPWKSGSFNKEEEKKTTTSKKTTTHKTTTTHKATTHTHKTTTTTHKETTHTHKTTTTHKDTITQKTTTQKTTTEKTTTIQKTITTTVVTTPETETHKTYSQTTKKEEPVEKTVEQNEKPAATSIAQKPVEKPVEKPVKKPVKKPETTPIAQKPIENVKEEEEEEEDHEEATDAPVTAGIIGCGVLGAAGVGLVMLKRNSPQRYDELKQKFPEAFGTVKRSISRGASTIKRGVSRSVSRRNTPNNSPNPASYTFTLSNDDGLPRVPLYDDPYPTTNYGSHHW